MVALRTHEPVQARAELNTTTTMLQVLEADPRHPRRDALPENTHYADTGCDLHPSCLSCPLERCRYDEPGGARKLMSAGRDGEVLSLQRRGDLTVDGIASRVGISRRTVFRILARARTSGTCS